MANTVADAQPVYLRGYADHAITLTSLYYGRKWIVETAVTVIGDFPSASFGILDLVGPMISRFGIKPSSKIILSIGGYRWYLVPLFSGCAGAIPVRALPSVLRATHATCRYTKDVQRL